MPSDDQHLNQATRNTSFLNTFYSNFEYNDWAVTVSFYSAIHVVEAVIFRKPELILRAQKISLHHSEDVLKDTKINPHNSLSYHLARKLIVNENFPEISAEFGQLYIESRTARYKCFTFDKLKTELLIKHCFKKILKWAKKTHGISFAVELKN